MRQYNAKAKRTCELQQFGRHVVALDSYIAPLNSKIEKSIFDIFELFDS